MCMPAPIFSIEYGMSRRVGSPSSRAATAARSIGSSPRSKPVQSPACLRPGRGRRLQVLEDAEAIRNLKARYTALCDNQSDAEGRDAIRNFFREASGIFSFAVHYSLN